MAAHQYLTDRELAALLRVDISTIRRWRYTGIGPPWVKCEGTVRYSRAALTAWLEARQSQAG